MIENGSTPPPKSVAVVPRPIEVIAVEDGAPPMALVLPPLDDLLGIAKVQNLQKFSLKEQSIAALSKNAAIFEEELQSLQLKTKKFGNSPIFLNRLADYAGLASKHDLEVQLVAEARGIAKSPFFEHRYADLALMLGRSEEALKIFEQQDLSTDVRANLRLAQFSLLQHNFDRAKRYVADALNIDAGDFGARLFDGALKIVEGQYGLAISSFRIAAEQRQNSVALQTNIGVAYALSGRDDKARAALRRAVAIDPLNEGAVVLLADVSHRAGHSEDCVPSLLYLLQFEQSDPNLWARLARAFISFGETNKGLEALRHEASIRNSAGVWNNIGVVHALKKNFGDAIQSFRYAWAQGGKQPSWSHLLAARNLAGQLTHAQKYDELLALVLDVFKSDKGDVVVRDERLADLGGAFLCALEGTGQTAKMVEVAKSMVETKDACTTYISWAASQLISYYALEENGSAQAIEYAQRFEPLLDSLADNGAKTALANNIAFAYLEAGDLISGERALSYAARKFHVQAFPTATLGLLQMRRNQYERATKTYREAIRLAVNRLDKNKLRQKLNFELAKLSATVDPKRALRYWEKVAQEQNGSRQLMLAAERRVKAIRQG